MLHAPLGRDRRRWDHFERVFARYRNADLSKADPKLAKGIEDIIKWRRRNRQAINRLLPQTQAPARPRSHPVSGAVDGGRGALRAEDYLAPAVSHPRFAQTSRVAAALFIV
jgi:hypothetical protein